MKRKEFHFYDRVGGIRFSGIISKNRHLKDSHQYKVNLSLFLRSYGLKRHSKSDALCSRPRNYAKFQSVRHTISALSSFADANEGNLDENIGQKDVKYYMENVSLVNGHDNKSTDVNGKNSSNGGMAEAFNISPKTAFGITVIVSLAALMLPLMMSSVTNAINLRIKVLSYATLLCGFYMAWNIGANDVANAMGTSVGSGALSLRQAVLIAAGLEFSGAFLVGSHVSHTMQNGILVADIFNGKNTLLFSGMLSSLVAAGTWLQVSSFLRMTYYGLYFSLAVRYD